MVYTSGFSVDCTSTEGVSLVIPGTLGRTEKRQSSHTTSRVTLNMHLYACPQIHSCFRQEFPKE